MEGKVLVLGDDTRSFLTVIRSLGRKSLQVHVGWCPQESEAISSKYITQVHHLPPYTANDERWKKALISLMKQECFDLVLPCNDQTLIPLQLHRADLEPYGKMYLLGEQAFSVVFDKFKTNELARTLQISVPRERVIANFADMRERGSDSFSWPVILKPCRSFSYSDLSRKNVVRKVYNTKECLAQLEELLVQEKVLVQENFEGNGVGIEVLAESGNVLMAFQHIRVHEPLDGGGSSYRKSAPLEIELYHAATKLMKALNYTGVAMVEFKVNTKTGKWILIEINGRFWGSLPLAVACGADFPYYLYCLLVRGERAFPQDYKNGIYCRNFSLDLNWMIANFKARYSGNVGSTISFWQVTKELKHFLTFQERNDTYVRDDRRPGFKELRNLIIEVRKKIQGKVLQRVLAWQPVRKLYQTRALRTMKYAGIVVFVCKGNICRSPFAEHYARRFLPDSVIIKSCGYYPKEGRASPQEAIVAAREFGVDLTAHCSTVISAQLVREAKIVFTFDEQNWQTLMEMFPWAKRKIFRLGLLAPSGPLNIHDPYSGTLDKFRAIYQSIACALGAEARNLNKP